MLSLQTAHIALLKYMTHFPPLSPYILHTRCVLINVPTLLSGSVRLMCLTCNSMSVFVIIDFMLQYKKKTGVEGIVLFPKA